MRIPNVMLFIGLLLACRAGSQEPQLGSLHIERNASFQLDGPPEKVFPLLEPRGRQTWVTHWSFEFLHPPSGEARPGTVVRQTLRNEVQRFADNFDAYVKRLQSALNAVLEKER